MKYDTQRPYLDSNVFLRNDEGKIAFLLRTNTSWMNQHYSLPAGKTEVGESFTAGAIREAAEEIGITVTAADLKPVLTSHRSSTADNGNIDETEWVSVYFEVLNYSGEPYNAEPHKHGELAWLDPANLPSNVIPSVKAAVEAWLDGKTYLEYGYNE